MKKNYEKILLADYETNFDYVKWYDKNIPHNILTNRGKEYCGKCGKLLSECKCKGIKREPLREQYQYKTKAVYPYNSACYIQTKVIKDYLVLRYFVVNCDEYIGQEANYWCKEVMRVGIDKKGKIKFARLKVKTIFWNWDFVYDSDMYITKFNDKYDVCIKANHINSSKKPSWLKYFNFEWLDKVNNTCKAVSDYGDVYSVMDFLRFYMSNQKNVETLCKCNRFDLTFFYMRYGHEIEIMKLLKHNKEIPSNNYLLYHDYLVGLEELQRDIRNIKVICPDDFESANKMVNKAHQKIKDAKELISNINLYNDKYVSRIGKLAGVIFGNDKYVFSILPDVKSFKEEADSMCHCVYRMGYYKNKDSYIFSVRNKENNKRLETAELKYDKLKNKLYVNQCYGYGDKFTEYHNQIVALIKKNLDNVRQYI